ncbi:MAG: ABC transporter substrate-binding protein [Methylobacteriaceae bacterium]|nr:ABC transporter substrate-binding protein [Methylobacteriaceae bacterium]MBV9633872.1 ABC transporter substrate-binding protein [Methylobacteriaceae bacterium]MBV9703944.1 ABC transporter substrate-binding protein [Methylobacteriaceae bacterium]
MRFRSLALALAVMAAACAPAIAQEKLTVLLDWFINPDHAPLIVAKEAGFFAKAGLDVSFVEPADPSTPPRLVAAGQGDIALTYQPNLYLQVKEGLPVVRIGTLVATPLNSLVVLADGPVKTIADLKGRTVGYSIAGFEQALLSTMLESAGLKLAEVKLVDINFALTPALLSGKVDAVIGAYRNFELIEMKLAGKAGHAFFPEEHGVPAYDELIYITAQDKAKDPRMAKFLGAVEDATVYLLNHPDESWQLFVKANPKLDDALNREAWGATLARFAASPAARDASRYARFAEYMKGRGLIDRIEPVERYIGP